MDVEIDNYNNLKRLYLLWLNAVTLERVQTGYNVNVNVNICEYILMSVVNYPISWQFYIQNPRFSSEFEDLIIFKS